MTASCAATCYREVGCGILDGGEQHIFKSVRSRTPTESILWVVDMANIRGMLIDLNPWWRGPYELEGYSERDLRTELEPFMEQPQIVAITGLRRVGKTTLLHKLAEGAVDEGPPTKVVYFSFDEHHRGTIREVLDTYQDITEEGLGEGDTLVLLDEIQKLEGWPDQLKTLYDMHKGNVKFVVSGSESLFIRAGSRETLAGRLFDFQLRPLSFREYLRFKEADYEPIGVHERELEAHFDAFLRTQGFPELVDVEDRAVARKYLRESLVERIVFRDLPTLTGLQNIEALESVLNILMEEPGQIVKVNDLAGQLDVSRKTLSNYLNYLEQAFLLRKLYNYSRSRRKVERKLRKFYPSILSVDLVYRDDPLARSRTFEAMIVHQLDAEFFWRDPYQHEVDIVLGKDEPIPVEVKWSAVNTDGVERFMEKFGVARGFVISRDVEQTREVEAGTIEIVPAYKFLLGSSQRFL